jgi:single-strand DNA-binding protein
MDVNRAMLVGRLTRDPETRTTPNGVLVATFSVATNYVSVSRDGTRREGVDFHNVVAWRKLAEIASQYLKKGRRILVEGRIQNRTFEGKDGTKQYRTEIVADNIIMLDPRGASPEGSTDAYDAGEAPSATQDAPAEGEITKEDIPF